MKSSSFLMRQWLNAKDFRTILAEDDTEKFRGYQGEIMSVSEARVIPRASATDEPDGLQKIE
jgi:hypothetical protein